MGGGVMSGAILSMASSGTVQLVQGWHYGSRSEKLSKLAYELDFQGLRLDVLSTIREEVRDQVHIIMSSLDNLMVVATLMLSIGFGFVVEGTFPPQKAEELGNWEIPWTPISIGPLAVYSFLCAMSLCMPFWCLIFTIRMRYEVEIIIRGHMSELRRQLCNVLQKKRIQEPQSPEFGAESPSTPSTRSDSDLERAVSNPLLAEDLHIDMARIGRSLRGFCPRRLNSVADSVKCPQRKVSVEKLPTLNSIPEHIGNAVDKVASHVGPYSIGNEPLAIEQAQILKWAEMDLMHRMSTYKFYLRLTHFLLWMGMLCAVFTCTILLGVYMMETFPNTPMMWRAYAYPVGISGAFGVLYAAWMFFSGSGPSAPGADSNLGGSSAAKLERYNSSGFSNSYQEPLLNRRASALFPDYSFMPSSNGRMETRGLELRVRDATSGSQSYRRVVVTPTPKLLGSAPQTVSFQDVERAVCAKFAGGKEHAEGYQRIKP